MRRGGTTDPWRRERIRDAGTAAPGSTATRCTCTPGAPSVTAVAEKKSTSGNASSAPKDGGDWSPTTRSEGMIGIGNEVGLFLFFFILFFFYLFLFFFLGCRLWVCFFPYGFCGCRARLESLGGRDKKKSIFL